MTQAAGSQRFVPPAAPRIPFNFFLNRGGSAPAHPIDLYRYYSGNSGRFGRFFHNILGSFCKVLESTGVKSSGFGGYYMGSGCWFIVGLAALLNLYSLRLPGVFRIFLGLISFFLISGVLVLSRVFFLRRGWDLMDSGPFLFWKVGKFGKANKGLRAILRIKKLKTRRKGRPGSSFKALVPEKWVKGGI